MSYTIIGGGIAGLSAAIALKNIGIQAQVYEAAAEMRPLGAGLMLAANAIKAYRRIGVAEKIIARGHLLSRFQILDRRGRIITSADTAAVEKRYGLHNFAIHRAALHEALLAELAPAQVETNMRAVGFDRNQNGEITGRFHSGARRTTRYLIVADGIHSAIRRQLFPASAPRYAGYTCWRAVVDDLGLGLDGASETWGAEGRFGVVPLAGGKVYWFACVNAPRDDPERRAYRAADLRRVFRRFHEPIPSILEHTIDENLIWNDIIDLKPLNRYAFENVVLIGDAAHATTPNLGQGACQAIEDAATLVAEMEKQPNPIAAFQAFERRRLPRARWVVDTSWRLGKIAQTSNPALAAMRDTLFRFIPRSVNEKQLERLLDVDF
jgi:2-polyprenyl-6-methoxyphenol hydroxylase-like FAD-dependent oxidoreductase